jgi:endonuclease-3
MSDDQIRGADAEKVAAIDARLVAHYGALVGQPAGDALGELIATILSQSTTDLNSGRAYHALRERYATWAAVLDAPISELYEVIKPAGLGNIKAARIRQTLLAVQERTGGFDLDFLAELPLDEARAWLTGLDGVGPKTAACVLLFALGMPALPVDTHVYRVARRTGMIGPRVSAERAHALLEQLVPPERVYGFHVALIRHGRTICQAQQPRCPICPLADMCDAAPRAVE